ncbi:MAG: DUF3137 domain-containing protein [Aquificaceae bacterium]
MDNLESIIEIVEKERNGLVKSTITWLSIYSTIGAIIYLFGMHYSSHSYLKLFGVAIFIAGAISTMSIKQGYYKGVFKELFLKSLFRHKFGENFEYRPQDYIRSDFFLNSMLFSHKPMPDRYRGEDLIIASVDSIRINFSEVHAQYLETQYVQGKKRQYWVDIFRGVFAIAEFPKTAKVPVVVLPNFEKVFSLPWEALKKVKLEDPEFEEIFSVWSKDQIEARYILSISLMRRMVEFYKKAREKGFKQDIYFSFVGKYMFFAINSGDFLRVPFYLSSFKSAYNSGKYDLYVQEVELILSIIEELNLKLDIWL